MPRLVARRPERGPGYGHGRLDRLDHERPQVVADPRGVDDALVYLARMALVHRLAGRDTDFFWPTRAAVAAEEVVTLPEAGEEIPAP